MFPTVCYFVNPLTVMLQKTVTVDAAGDDRQLIAVLRHSRNTRAIRSAWMEWSRRTLARSFAQHKHILRYVAGSVHVRIEHSRQLTTFWRKLEEFREQLDNVPSTSRTSYTDTLGVVKLQGADGTLHSMPVEALMESRMLIPLLKNSQSSNLIVPIPTWNGHILFALVSVLRGDFHYLNFVSDDSLAQILAASDFLDLKILFEAVWLELKRRATLIQLRDVPKLMARVRHLRSFEYGQSNELADILCSLADAVTELKTAQLCCHYHFLHP